MPLWLAECFEARGRLGRAIEELELRGFFGLEGTARWKGELGAFGGSACISLQPYRDPHHP